MISNKQFVNESIKLNLFFLRILKEHLFFIEASLPYKNIDIIQQAYFLRSNLNCLLIEIINLADGNISKDFKESGEMVTRYTHNAEQATQSYTGIPIDSVVTGMQLSLNTSQQCTDSFASVKKMERFNDKAVNAACCIARFIKALLSNVLKCKVFVMNYPMLIEHVLEETDFYIMSIGKLQKRQPVYCSKDFVEQQIFWDQVLAEHSKFIRGLLDPSEKKLFEKADYFACQFDRLYQKAEYVCKNPQLLPKLTYNTKKAVQDICDFKKAAIQGLLECKIKSMILPLLADHLLRETNHYLRVLKEYKLVRR